MRIIIYTGKGGVGKTSVAAATACRLAKQGKKVLIMSTDAAHSLGDSFDCTLLREPVRVSFNLDALELDTVYEGEKSWGSIKGYMKEMLTVQGTDGIEVEELLVFPGLEELFAMFRILEFYEEGNYDILIVDCAPTGETLSLLKYPETLSGFLNKVLPIKRIGLRAAGPLIEKTMKIPMPEDSIFDDLEYIMNKMEKLQKLMLDKEVVSLRLVATPEKIVIREAKRSFTCLYLFNYNVDAVIINRIYPKQAMEGYFGKWNSIQEESLREIRESFSEVPKFYLELQKEEVRTLPVLEAIGEMLFKDRDVSAVLFRDDIYSVERTDDELSLRILLPFAEKEELELSQNGNELVLAVKNEVRRFPLPLDVQDKEIQGARYEKGYLRIRFALSC